MQDVRIIEVSPAFAQAMEDRLFAQAYERQRVAQELARTVRGARKAHRITQTELAARIGSTQPSLSRLENGKIGDVGMELIHRIGKAMGLEAAVVFRERVTGP